MQLLKAAALVSAIVIMHAAIIYGCSWAVEHSDAAVDLANQYLDASE